MTPEPDGEDPAKAEQFQEKKEIKSQNPWPDPGTPDGGYDSPETLYELIRKFLDDHLDFMDAREFVVVACFILASFRLDDFEAVLYLFFLGPANSGKTRALECLWQLCHRGTLVSSISPSALFRLIHACHPTLLIDETESYSREEHGEIRAILNSGYRRGQMVVRSVKSGSNDDYELGMFDPYGFKALAGTREMWDTLRSRCIEIHMQRATRRILTMLDKDRAAKLRAMLQHYALHHQQTNVTADQLTEKIPDPRVVELFLPLVTVAPTEEVRSTLIQYASEIARGRVEDETTSLEAKVVDAIVAIKNTHGQDGKLAVKAITDRLNLDLEEHERYRRSTVGKVLARLGFRRTRVGHGAAHGICLDLDLIARLVKRYRIGEKG